MRFPSFRVLCLACCACVMTPVLPAPDAKMHRVGVLETRSESLNRGNMESFREGLRDLGYVQGVNVELLYRSSDGRDDRFPALAQELLRARVDVILTRGTPATLAAKQATRTVPIVMAASGDPVGAGIVPNLAHPGGNVTGLSFQNVEIYGKRVEVLREILPKAKRLGVLFNMGNPVLRIQWEAVSKAARSLGMEPHLLDVRAADALRPALDEAVKAGDDAVIVGLDGVTQANLALIAEEAVAHRLASVAAVGEYVEAGGLAAYGPSDPRMYYRAAAYVDKILKGARPGDISIEQPTQFDLALNMRTAQRLGLDIPKSLVLRATDVKR